MMSINDDLDDPVMIEHRRRQEQRRQAAEDFAAYVQQARADADADYEARQADKAAAEDEMWQLVADMRARNDAQEAADEDRRRRA